jgi:hypothetical protein
MLPSRVTRVVVVALATVAVACGDPTKPIASSPYLPLSFSLYALTGTPSGTVNAINFFAGPRRVDPDLDFDVALDLDPNGQVVVYPIRAIAGPLGASATRIGLQQMTGTFDALREAPKTGYDTLSILTVAPGTPIAVQLVNLFSNVCVFSLNGVAMYGKFVIDSVDQPTRRLFVRTVTDPNCGFRSLVPDSIPKF